MFADGLFAGVTGSLRESAVEIGDDKVTVDDHDALVQALKEFPIIALPLSQHACYPFLLPQAITDTECTIADST